MTDKERILTHIISVYYPRYILSMREDDFNFSDVLEINVGDLVLSISSGLHNFTIGYVVEIKNKSEMVIREIGSKRTCNISNEMFYKIDQSHLKDEYLLEGLQYKVYSKVMKAISNIDGHKNRFHSISFHNNTCTVNLRLKFDNKINNTFSFIYSSRTTIKEIEKEVEKIINK